MTNTPLDDLINYRINRAEEIFNELFNLRHESDYEDFFQAGGDLVLPMIPQVKRFLEFIKQIL